MVKAVGFWFLAISGLLLGCDTAPTYLDNTNTEPVTCIEQIDCYSYGNLEVGTDCINNQCVCHEPGEAHLPCCKKGADPYDCDRKCRQADQCAGAPDTGGGSAGGAEGAGGAGGAGGMSGGLCNTAADCPGPDDAACGEAKCVDNVCQLELKPLEKVASQIRGDCVSQYCNGLGKLVTLPDGEDTYNDGRQCSIDVCQNGEPKNVLLDGSPCPETGLGYCSAGECVNCHDGLGLGDCGPGSACDNGRCVPGHCTNKSFDFPDGETAVDCGGPCNPCPVGFGCKKPADCQHQVCVSGKCAPPTCSDGIKNDSETDVDCGGLPSCPRCAVGAGCNVNLDCTSGVCWAGICEKPTCTDGIQNGDEAGIDCGGSMCAPCSPK